jgi:DNA-binding CsgD family transcriptional regulator
MDYNALMGNSPSEPCGLAGLAASLPAEAVWSALVSEPGTGVSIFDIDGRCLFMSQSACDIFIGRGVRSEQVNGRHARDFFPEEWVAQRLVLLQTIRDSGDSRGIRTIWRGYQQITWITLIQDEADESTATNERIKERFLCITRRVSADTTAEVPDGVEIVDSTVMRLGPLDALSARELEVLALIGQGLSLKEIASVVHRSYKTVDNHRAAIGAKLKVDDRVKLAEIARRAGLTLADAERPRV